MTKNGSSPPVGSRVGPLFACQHVPGARGLSGAKEICLEFHKMSSNDKCLVSLDSNSLRLHLAFTCNEIISFEFPNAFVVTTRYFIMNSFSFEAICA